MDRPTVRRELPLLLELSGLCGLAIALPALDVLGHSPDFLVLERLDAADLVFLAAMVALAPPLALAASGAVAGLAGPGPAGPPTWPWWPGSWPPCRCRWVGT